MIDGLPSFYLSGGSFFYNTTANLPARQAGLVEGNKYFNDSMLKYVNKWIYINMKTLIYLIQLIHS